MGVEIYKDVERCAKKRGGKKKKRGTELYGDTPLWGRGWRREVTIQFAERKDGRKVETLGA